MALDKGAGDSLFGSLKKPAAERVEVTPEKDTDAIKAVQAEPTAKWQTLDKVTVLLTTEQKEGLDRVAKKLMKYRSKDLKGNESKERITANTLMRALIENFLDMEEAMQLEVLSSEDDVHKWVSNAFKNNV